MFAAIRNVGLLILAASLAYWFWNPQGIQLEDDEISPVEDQQPDIFGKNVKFHQLNPDGSLHYRLRAVQIQQYGERQYTDMIKPHLHLLSAEQPPWDIDSERGNIQVTQAASGTREERVELDQNVQMVQTHPENGVTTLRSEVFVLFPNRQYAETDQNVTIDTNVSRTVAAGLAADLKKGVLKLSSSKTQRVHTIVLPEQFKKT